MGVFFSSSGEKAKGVDRVDPPCSIDNLSNDELLAMIEEAVRENRYVGAPVPSPIFQRPVHVTPNIVAKCIHTPDMSMSEVYMTAYASDFTTIPIPCIRRVIYLDLYAWLVMDHVKGETLDVLWPRMSWWRRLRVVWTIRGYIRQLRRIPLPNPDIPGPFNGIGVPNKCEGFYFTEDGAGPFNSYADLVAWYDLKRQITSYYEPNNNAPFPSFDASEPLTFVHGDLNMRNIIIDKDDEAWLIDFGFAGAYPPWFEYAGIVLFAGMDSVHPRSWAFFAPFMAGFYERQYRFLQRIQYAISYWVLELPKSPSNVEGPSLDISGSQENNTILDSSSHTQDPTAESTKDK